MMDFPGGASGKESACQCKRCKRFRFDPLVRRFPGEGHGNPLQYSCLKNPMNRGAWWATVHRVANSWTQLKRLSTHTTRPWEFLPLSFLSHFTLSGTLKLHAFCGSCHKVIPHWGLLQPCSLRLGPWLFFILSLFTHPTYYNYLLNINICISFYNTHLYYLRFINMVTMRV